MYFDESSNLQIHVCLVDFSISFAIPKTLEIGGFHLAKSFDKRMSIHYENDISLCKKEPDSENDVILDKNKSHSENDWPNHLFIE